MQLLDKVSRKGSAMAAPLLLTGDRMRQPEFHRRYEACADDVRFELIGGTVYMASPLSLPHSDYDEELGFAFGLYRRATPGIEVLRGVSIILGEFSEPQPDLGLRISPDHGDQSRTTSNKKCVLGAPELLGEIAFSTRAIDMKQKRLDYRSAGVAGISGVMRGRTAKTCTGLTSAADARPAPYRRDLPLARLARIMDQRPRPVGSRLRGG